MPIDVAPLLSPPERQRLLVEWNETRTDYPRDACVHDLFAAQAARTPDAIAVVYEDERLTYRALDERTNQLAHYLRRLGVGPDALVGLCVERSVDMVVGLLGILKAGGAYVPLEPTHPRERLALVINDTRLATLVTHRGLQGRLPTFAGSVVRLDEDRGAIALENVGRPRGAVAPRNLAYVLFTSGSTGTPKGVLIEHGGLCNLAMAQCRAFALSSSDRVLQFASFTFDASASEVVMALTSGATLYLASPDDLQPGPPLARKLRGWSITIVTLPPSLLSALAPDDLPALRALIVAGEAALPDVVARWAHTRRFFNAYGPTEASVCATLGELSGTDPCVTIGRPIANTHIYILDGHLQPVPIGVPGEIHIGGVGLARGYLNRPELTAERFIPHPFSDDPTARLYKTGDLARYRPDGAIEFLGRLDHQVKIRGYRIELGEIEAALRAHPGVRDAVVVARADAPGGARLVAYVVPHRAQVLTVAEARSFLEETLPAYMIPSAVVTLDALPLTHNGKVNRAALPAPQRVVVAPDGATDPAAAPDASMRQMLHLWEEVLEVRPIQPTDNFFDLGGHSLLAVRLFHRIEQEYGVRLPLATLFQEGTAAHLDRVLRQAAPMPPFAAVPLQPHGSRPPLFLLPTHEGNPLFYRHLVDQLGADQPVYAIEVRDDHAARLRERTVEEVAADFVRVIRACQPEGPYFLGGYSFGGVLAFEVAHQLRAAEQDVPLLALFDTLCPGAPTPVQRGAVVRMGTRVGLQSQRVLGMAASHVALLRALPPREKLGYIAWRTRNARQRVLRRVRRTRRTRRDPYATPPPVLPADPLSAVPDLGRLARYVPRPYPGPITLFWALRNPLYALGADDPRRGWRHLAGGGLTVYRLWTDHHGLMAGPFEIRQIAKRFQRSLAEAQGVAHATGHHAGAHSETGRSRR